MKNRLMKWTFFSILLALGLQTSTIVAEEDTSHVYYYILIDRFENGEPEGDSDIIDRDDPAGFHGGDYVGIEKNIEHLNEIGVSHVILSPIFQSNDYLGQEILSYENLQGTYGSEEELNQLVESFHEAGIDVLVEAPLHQMSSDADLISREWVSAEGQVDFSDERATDYFIEQLSDWQDRLNVDGFYIPEAEELPTEVTEALTSEIEGHWLGGFTTPESLEEGLDRFDEVIRFGDHEQTFESFKGFDADFSHLLEQSHFDSERVAHYIDFLHTDRFTRALEPTGNHPVTRWKLALTYLFTVPNDPVLFQGTEIPMDGSIDDRSTHQLLNFLVGDEQVTRHVEKLASARNNFEALQEGDMEVLHEADGFLAFSRTLGEEELYILINTTQTAQNITLSDVESGKEMRGLLENDLVRQGDSGNYRLQADRESANIYVVDENSGIYWPLTIVVIGIMSVFIIFAIVMYRKNRHKDI